MPGEHLPYEPNQPDSTPAEIRRLIDFANRNGGDNFVDAMTGEPVEFEAHCGSTVIDDEFFEAQLRNEGLRK